MPKLTDDTLDERNWLMTLVTEAGHQPVTDSGYDFPGEFGEFVYETPQGRWNVQVRKVWATDDHS